jgi:hypothetical protein
VRRQVHVVIREDQNQHGYIDSGVVGVFRKPGEAKAYILQAESEAQEAGMRVFGEAEDEADWEVCWFIEQQPLR